MKTAIFQQLLMDASEVAALFANTSSTSAYNLAKGFACIEGIKNVSASEKLISYHQFSMKMYRQNIQNIMFKDLAADAQTFYKKFAIAQTWKGIVSAFEQPPADPSFDALSILEQVENLILGIVTTFNHQDTNWHSEASNLQHCIYREQALSFIVNSIALMNSDVGVDGASSIFSSLETLQKDVVRFNKV
jgi:hypothetical protein